MTVFGCEVDKSEGFTVTRGNRDPEKYESYNAALAKMRSLYGSTLTYKVIIKED